MWRHPEKFRESSTKTWPWLELSSHPQSAWPNQQHSCQQGGLASASRGRSVEMMPLLHCRTVSQPVGCTLGSLCHHPSLHRLSPRFNVNVGVTSALDLGLEQRLATSWMGTGLKVPSGTCGNLFPCPDCLCLPHVLRKIPFLEFTFWAPFLKSESLK